MKVRLQHVGPPNATRDLTTITLGSEVWQRSDVPLDMMALAELWQWVRSGRMDAAGLVKRGFRCVNKRQRRAA
jgi:hypothetical protein